MRKDWDRTVGAFGTARRNPLAGLVALCVVVTFLLTSGVPSAFSDVRADPGSSQVRWDDTHRYVGNCTQQPAHDSFSVNDTALYFDITIDFRANATFPGAIFELRGPDSYDVISEDIYMLSYHVNVTDLSKRGTWSVALTMNYCSFISPVDYLMNLTVHNRHLGAVSTDGTDKVVTGQTLHVHLKDFELADGDRIRLDLGDGNITDLGNQTSFDASYGTPGAYTLRAQVVTGSGTSTGWRAGPQVTVEKGKAGNSGTMSFSTTGALIAVVLLVMLGAVIFLVSRP